MIDWPRIDTVLLDMDGTLLDLHFDNFFWLEYLPQRYAEIKGVDHREAREHIVGSTRAIAGTLEWYSTDHWSRVLAIDVVALKREIGHKVSIRPYCVEFLDALREAGKQIVMVTNAHHDSLALKMERTRLAHRFDSLITVHEFALPKEDPKCWAEVNKRHPFDPGRTLLIDDNLRALASAREFGIAALLGIYQPDSTAPRNAVDGFDAIHSFAEIMPIAGSGENGA